MNDECIERGYSANTLFIDRSRSTLWDQASLFSEKECMLYGQVTKKSSSHSRYEVYRRMIFQIQTCLSEAIS